MKVTIFYPIKWEHLQKTMHYLDILKTFNIKKWTVGCSRDWQHFIEFDI